MATVTRQPFAPLDGTRLQTLTSLKNRQNALPTGGKRKAELIDTDDSENVDPTSFAKRSKGSKDKGILKDSILKPTPVSAFPIPNRLTSPTKTRRTLQPKSPAKLSSGISKSSPIYAPAGRSPTRSKRSGIASSRRRTAGPYTRVDPPSFSLGSAAPFSLDAALKGTIPGYGAKKEPITALHEPDMKASWFFEIHEDTPEQEMTNLLQHSTCVLDISSDEESQRKLNRDRAEGRDKENVPPPDDISQTRRAPKADDMIVEKERVALGEMNTADFYAEGCDETSVIFVPEDEPEVNAPAPAPATAEKPIEPSTEDIDSLMAKPTEGSSKAAVLEPIEGTGENFELWESGSAHDETV
ncbi:thymidylate kinase [Fusarium tjaetaba]|uniref:Thymidylate kinase n=1 Tax=Fusarium tjaetaba TaxID=1567544 RepID=A0A8H5RGC1_9HYPO|nr:thymidylate kinase [Fusarium tjaetaba]KAF5632550.1 thymidylate kinase [Fusarium tjaetaba]